MAQTGQQERSEWLSDRIYRLAGIPWQLSKTNSQYQSQSQDSKKYEGQYANMNF
jgi:hypothetical protein